MSKCISNNRGATHELGFILRKIGNFAAGLALVVFEVLREIFVSMESNHNEERRLHDSDLSGEFNHRTGRLDAGTDPYGWYDN